MNSLFLVPPLLPHNALAYFYESHTQGALTAVKEISIRVASFAMGVFSVLSATVYFVPSFLQINAYLLMRVFSSNPTSLKAVLITNMRHIFLCAVGILAYAIATVSPTFMYHNKKIHHYLANEYFKHVVETSEPLSQANTPDAFRNRLIKELCLTYSERLSQFLGWQVYCNNKWKIHNAIEQTITFQEMRLQIALMLSVEQERPLESITSQEVSDQINRIALPLRGPLNLNQVHQLVAPIIDEQLRANQVIQIRPHQPRRTDGHVKKIGLILMHYLKQARNDLTNETYMQSIRRLNTDFTNSPAAFNPEEIATCTGVGYFSIIRWAIFKMALSSAVEDGVLILKTSHQGHHNTDHSVVWDSGDREHSSIRTTQYMRLEHIKDQLIQLHHNLSSISNQEGEKLLDRLSALEERPLLSINESREEQRIHTNFGLICSIENDVQHAFFNTYGLSDGLNWFEVFSPPDRESED